MSGATRSAPGTIRQGRASPRNTRLPPATSWVIAETGAGQHGIATASTAARFGLQCTIYMGEVDVARQRPNVFWMERLGATVVPVRDGSRTLKDAVNEAFRDWMTNLDTTHYVLGTACGPHPFPEMVTWFQSIIGREARRQVLEQAGGFFSCPTTTSCTAEEGIPGVRKLVESLVAAAARECPVQGSLRINRPHRNRRPRATRGAIRCRLHVLEYRR